MLCRSAGSSSLNWDQQIIRKPISLTPRATGALNMPKSAFLDAFFAHLFSWVRPSGQRNHAHPLDPASLAETVYREVERLGPGGWWAS